MHLVGMSRLSPCCLLFALLPSCRLENAVFNKLWLSGQRLCPNIWSCLLAAPSAALCFFFFSFGMPFLLPPLVSFLIDMNCCLKFKDPSVTPCWCTGTQCDEQVDWGIFRRNLIGLVLPDGSPGGAVKTPGTDLLSKGGADKR